MVVTGLFASAHANSLFILTVELIRLDGMTHFMVRSVKATNPEGRLPPGPRDFATEAPAAARALDQRKQIGMNKPAGGTAIQAELAALLGISTPVGLQPMTCHVERSKPLAADLAKPWARRMTNLGYGSGIYNSASYYQSHGLSQQSYRSDLSNALHSSSASAAAASSGFASAMAQALEGSDYRTYGYSCAGAIGYGSTGSWTSAFGQVCFSQDLQSVGLPE
ncbi:TPA: hypothetical protein ACH3X2_004718 [Trebouxia sp. C0005]